MGQLSLGLISDQELRFLFLFLSSVPCLRETEGDYLLSEWLNKQTKKVDGASVRTGGIKPRIWHGLIKRRYISLKIACKTASELSFKAYLKHKITHRNVCWHTFTPMIFSAEHGLSPTVFTGKKHSHHWQIGIIVSVCIFLHSHTNNGIH